MADAVLHTTGQIRRITDVGQIIIPKEVRRLLNIKDGDPLECYIYGDMVCFKKYNADSALRLATDQYAEKLEQCTIGLPTEQSHKLKKLVKQLNELVDTELGV